MSDWQLLIEFHFPHDRLLFGWEFIKPDDKYDYFTFRLYLFIATLTLDIECRSYCSIYIYIYLYFNSVKNF